MTIRRPSPDGIGELLLHLRQAEGRSRAEQALHLEGYQGGCQFDVENLKRWETERRLPTSFWYPLLSAGYGVPIDEIRRRVSISRQYRKLAGTLAKDEDTSDLRPIMSQGGASHSWGRLAAALSPPPVDETVVHDVANRTAELHEIAQKYKPSVAFKLIEGHLDYLSLMLPSAGERRRDIAFYASGTAALAGYTAYDMGDDQLAASFYTVARHAADEAGAKALEANIIANMSYGVSDPRKAASSLSAARLLLLRCPGSATASSWISALEAHSAAIAGQREQAMCALSRAYARYEDASPATDLLWVGFFTEARLHCRAASVYAAFKHPRVSEAIADAIATVHEPGSREEAVVKSLCARAAAQAGEKDQAVALMADAREINSRVRCRTVTDTLSTVSAAQ